MISNIGLHWLSFSVWWPGDTLQASGLKKGVSYKYPTAMLFHALCRFLDVVYCCGFPRSLPDSHRFVQEKGVSLVIMDSAWVRVLAAYCIGRWNSYAVQQEQGRYRRVRQPLTWDLLHAHLAGGLTLGTYLINEQGRCRFAVFDADARSAQDDLGALVEVQRRLLAVGVPSVLEQSRRGGHLWVFLAQAVLPSVVRRWLLPLCPASVELYPKQERATWEEPGALMRVPLGVHRRSGRRYPFLHQVGGQLVPVARTVGETLRWLGQVERVSVPAVTMPAQQPEPAPHTYVAPGGAVGARAPFASIHAWCASQDSVSVIRRYVPLDRRGMGCCPFGEHHSDGRDTHPSFWVHEPRGPGAPCWYCHVWGRGGNLFDFLMLYTGLDARSLWARIQAGEVF